MKPNPESDKLARGLERALALAGPWSGEAYRATAVEYANRDDIITGQGAKRAGGRWNPPGGSATVYASLTPEAALAEYLAQHRYFGFKDSAAMPYVMVGLEVVLEKALDLTAGPARSALGVSLARMTAATWRKAKRTESLTQAVGRLAFEAGLEALIVPSAAVKGASNLVVFPGNLVPPGSYVRVVNRDQLPPLIRREK